MLNHRNSILFFGGILFILFGLNHYFPVHWVFSLVVVIIFSLVQFYGAAFVQSGFHIKTINKLNTTEKIVALTFDDGPEPENTEKLLSVLAKYQAKATFFCIGKKVKNQAEILNKIIAEGHEIGNHSYSHSNLIDLKNTQQLLSDFTKANEEIFKVTGKTPQFFRPPFGVTTPSLGKACRQLNFKVIGWNVRSLDTKIQDKEKIVARVIQKIKPGSIILLHDIVPHCEDILEEILKYLQANNYKVGELKQYI